MAQDSREVVDGGLSHGDGTKSTWEIASQKVRIETFLLRDCSLDSLPCRILIHGKACHVRELRPRPNEMLALLRVIRSPMSRRKISPIFLKWVLREGWVVTA